MACWVSCVCSGVNKMNLQTCALRYHDRFVARFGHALNIHQWRALNAIEGCRQGGYGEVLWACNGCDRHLQTPRSCGHRACNLCQHHSTQDWLARQQQKQLPVHYYMVTFTLPRALRGIAWAHPALVYNSLMRCAATTLKTFAGNDQHLQGTPGLCAVLHTHTRRLDYHPHVHVLMPGGVIHRGRKEWRTVRGRYLFNGRALAKAFRGAFLRALNDAGIRPPTTPQKWIAQCKRVGKGQEALRYLSRYLYRGVISNANLVEDDGTHITFRYRDSNTHRWKTRRVRGEVLLWLVLQHTLPTGFRRSRDYGFLHGNAKPLLRIVQWVFRVVRPPPPLRQKASLCCPACKGSMLFAGIRLRTASG